MKRLHVCLLAVLVALASIFPANAQEKGSLRLNYGVGGLSFTDYIGLLLIGLGSIDTSEGVTQHSFTPLTNPYVGLEYHLNPRVSLGGTLAFGGGAAWTKHQEDASLSKTATCIYPTLLLSASTQYFRNENFAMYGNWGMGASLYCFTQSDKNSSTNNSGLAVIPNANIYPLCFSFGKQAGFNVELGWGAKGLLCVGGYWTFPGK